MAKQKTLKGFAIAKGKEFKGKFPKQYAKLKIVYAENKLDGLRGVIIVRKGKAKAYTSSGVLVPNAKYLCALFEKHSFLDNRMYDAEYFAKNWNLTQSIVKTQKPHDKAKLLQFKMFDTVALSEWDAKKGITPLEKRKHILARLIGKVNRKIVGKTAAETTKNLKRQRLFVIQPIPIAPDAKAVRHYMKAACKAGHEGVMVKDPTAPYSFKRSADWLKLKPKRESDLKIVGAALGTEGLANGKRLGNLIVVGVVDGKKIKCDIGGGFKSKERDDLWKMYKAGKLVGRVAQIEHEGVTTKGALRFPEFIRLHAEK